MKRLCIHVHVLLGMLLIPLAWCAPGDIDFSFNAGSGLDAYAFSVLPTPNGKLMAVGTFRTVRGAARTGIALLQEDGSADLSFIPPQIENPSISRVAFAPGGKVIISGARIDPVNFWAVGSELKRLNADGSVDPTFVPESPLGLYIQAMAVQSDGKVIVTGAFNIPAGAKRERIARLNPDGSLDAGFDADSLFDSDIHDLEIQADGKILAGGSFTGTLKRLNSNGTLDTSFQATDKLDGYPTDLSIDRSGNILVAGSFTLFGNQPRSCVARITSAGVLDSTFAVGLNVDNSVQAIREDPDGRVLIGGYFIKVDGLDRVGLARLGANGRLDAAFVPPPVSAGPYAPVFAINFDSAGRLLAAGSFEWLDGNRHLARLINNGAADPSFVPRDPIANPFLHVSAIALQPDFKSLVAISRQNFEGSTIQRMNLDGSFDDSFAPISMPGQVDVIYVQRDGKILAASRYWTGSFVPELKRFQHSGAPDPTFNVVSGPTRPIAAILQMPDDDIIIATPIGSINGRPANQILRLEADGSSSTDYTERSTSREVSGIATALALQDGKLLIAFSNDGCGCSNPKTLIRVHANGSPDSTFDTTQVEPQHYSSLAVQPDRKILAGGLLLWHRAPNITHQGIIRFNPDGSIDSSFRSQLPHRSDVTAIGLETSGKIIVNDRGSVLRLNTDGSIDTTFPATTGVGQSPHILAMLLQPDGNILAAGQFNSLNFQPRARIARILGTTIPIPLRREINGNEITLHWSHPAFRLQSTTSLDQPFQDVPSALFSWKGAVDSGQSYFRLKSN